MSIEDRSDEPGDDLGGALDPDLATATCEDLTRGASRFAGRLACVHDLATGRHVGVAQPVEPRVAVMVAAGSAPQPPLVVIDALGRHVVRTVHTPGQDVVGEMAAIVGLELEPGEALDRPLGPGERLASNPKDPRSGGWEPPWICTILPNLDCCRR